MPSTKADLAKSYNVCANTVYRTLQACGLPTSQKTYSDDQEDVFRAARHLADDKLMNYEQIAAHFNVGKKAADAPEDPDGRNYSQAQSQDTSFGIDSAIFGAVNDSIANSAQRARKVVPALIQMHLAKELSSPEFQAEMRVSIAQMNARQEGDVNDFLLRGMEMAGLLPPSMQRQQASLPQSDDY